MSGCFSCSFISNAWNNFKAGRRAAQAQKRAREQEGRTKSKKDQRNVDQLDQEQQRHRMEEYPNVTRQRQPQRQRQIYEMSPFDYLHHSQLQHPIYVNHRGQSSILEQRSRKTEQQPKSTSVTQTSSYYQASNPTILYISQQRSDQINSSNASPQPIFNRNQARYSPIQQKPQFIRQNNNQRIQFAYQSNNKQYPNKRAQNLQDLSSYSHLASQNYTIQNTSHQPPRAAQPSQPPRAFQPPQPPRDLQPISIIPVLNHQQQSKISIPQPNNINPYQITHQTASLPIQNLPNPKPEPVISRVSSTSAPKAQETIEDQAEIDNCLSELRHVEGKPNNQQDLAYVYAKLCLAYRILNPSQSIKYGQKSISLYKQFPLNTFFEEISTVQNNLGFVYAATGNYIEAIKQFEDALSIQKRYYSRKDQRLIATSNNIKLVREIQ